MFKYYVLKKNINFLITKFLPSDIICEMLPRNINVHKSAYKVWTLCLLIFLLMFGGVVFKQKPEAGNIERETSSLLIPVAGQATQNNSDLSVDQIVIQITGTKVFPVSIYSYSVFNKVDVSLYPPGPKHSKHKVVNPSYIALEEEVDVLNKKAGVSQFPSTITDCACFNISGTQTKSNLSLSLPVSPHYKPKQTLRWHMII